MPDDKATPKTIGIDELVQSITTATLRAIKKEQPDIRIEQSGLFVNVRVHCGIPAVTDREGLKLEAED